MRTPAGRAQWGWLLGEGEARGIALVCFFAGLIMVAAALLAFTTRSYRTLTTLYETSPDPAPQAEEESDAAKGVPAASDLPGAPPPVPGNPPPV